jgi:hypothetical protein
LLREVLPTVAEPDVQIYRIINRVACYMFRPPAVVIFWEVLKLILLLLADTEGATGMNDFKKSKNVGVCVNM